MRNLLTAAVAFLTLVAAFAGPSHAGKTLPNLQEAYNGESNAHARYAAFAEKADAEGYTKVASIFRAAARAESIHAANHAAVIRSLGGEPTADVVAPTVKSTAENLQAAIDGESYERDTMYPEFIATARAEGLKDAVRTFNFAVEAEALHAQLYADALKSLDRMKGEPLTLYVCSTCGRTVLSLDGEKCPVCFTANEKFIKVS
jgi:rubrerythrin